MIITISGTPGSGKSTIGKAVAKALNLKRYSAGDFMGQIAIKRGVSLMELAKQALVDPSIDNEIDSLNRKLAKEDNFVIDARVGFHFIPNAINIFVKVDPKVGAKRIWGDIQAKKRTDEKGFKSEKEVLDGLLKRKEIEIKRYKTHYNVDFSDESHYDFVLDTSNLTIEQSVQKVLDFIKSR